MVLALVKLRDARSAALQLPDAGARRKALNEVAKTWKGHAFDNTAQLTFFQTLLIGPLQSSDWKR